MHAPDSETLGHGSLTLCLPQFLSRPEGGAIHTLSVVLSGATLAFGLNLVEVVLIGKV